jgi:hypothetical protein
MEQIKELTGQEIYDREVSDSKASNRQGNYEKGSWIGTYRGHKIFPINPDPNEIDIQDIAHALGNNCRYTGHVNQFYSVAQHCVIVSELVQPENALAGLLHDASEAYLSDIARPVKYSKALEGYREVEAKLERVINEKFGLPYPMVQDVKWADDMALMAEGYYLFKPIPDWVTERLSQEGLDKPMIPRFFCWPPVTAKAMYIKRFLELNGVKLSIATDEDFLQMERMNGASKEN